VCGTAFQLMQRAREPSFILAMIGNTNMRDMMVSELCKVDPAQSILVLPPGGDLRHRLCAADRLQLMQFALDLYRYVNRSTIQRQVGRLSTLYRCIHLLLMSVCPVAQV